LILKGKILKAHFLLRTQLTPLLVFVRTLKHSAARYQQLVSELALIVIQKKKFENGWTKSNLC